MSRFFGSRPYQVPWAWMFARTAFIPPEYLPVSIAVKKVIATPTAAPHIRIEDRWVELVEGARVGFDNDTDPAELVISVDLSGYATEEWVGLKGYLTAHQTIKTLASKTLTGPGDVTLADIGAAADGAVLKKASNLSDLADAGVARSELGGTTVGQSIFTATNPDAIRYLKIKADNTVTLRTAAEMLTDLGAPTAASEADIADGSGTGFMTPATLAALAADPGAISGGASNTFDWSVAVNYTMELTGDRTLSNPTNVQEGTTRVIRVSSDSATERTLSFGNKFINRDLPEVKVTDDDHMILFLYATSDTEVYVGVGEI